jgi:A/G-specific adenine glycosylase
VNRASQLPDPAVSAARLGPQLLAWWDEHGRKHLPWQQEPTPYRVWVSEIMLQQTQVATVERYYTPFMRRFPDVAALAAAPQDEVLHHWSGLGYYSRARNLHKAAQVIAADCGGVLPVTLDGLMALPGIGRSTAGAILALSGDQRHPILDGNVKRVLARFFAVEGWSGSTPNLKLLWAHAEACTPQTRVANYTQAIMDLGATLCSRSRPACALCPLRTDCRAYTTNRVSAIPAPKPRRQVRPQRSAVLVMARRGPHEVLLEKRPASGIWGGLWSFPEFADLDAVAEWVQSRFGAGAAPPRVWDAVTHSFSHFDFEMTPVEIEVRAAEAVVMEAGRWLWYNTRNPENVGLAAPVAKLLRALADS